MVTMSSFGKFQSGSNTELFQEIRTIYACTTPGGGPGLSFNASRSPTTTSSIY